MLIGKPLAELQKYRPQLTKQGDFDVFWDKTLAEHIDPEPKVTLTRIEFPVNQLEVAVKVAVIAEAILPMDLILERVRLLAS